MSLMLKAIKRKFKSEDGSKSLKHLVSTGDLHQISPDGSFNPHTFLRRTSCLGQRLPKEELLRRFREAVTGTKGVVTMHQEFVATLSRSGPGEDEFHSVEARNSAQKFQDVLLNEAWEFQESMCRKAEEAELHFKALQTQRIKDATKYRDSVRAMHQDLNPNEEHARSFESLLDHLDEATRKLVIACVREEVKSIIHAAECNREGVLYQLMREKLVTVQESVELRVKEAQKDSDELRWQVKELRKQLNCAFHELAEARFNEQETNDLRKQADALRVKLAHMRQELDEAHKNLSRSEAVRLEQLKSASVDPVDFSESLKDLKRLSIDLKVDEPKSHLEPTSQNSDETSFAHMWRTSSRAEPSTGHVGEGVTLPSSFCTQAITTHDLQQAHIAVEPVGDEAPQTGRPQPFQSDSISDVHSPLYAECTPDQEQREGDDWGIADPNCASAGQLLAHARVLSELLEDEPKKGSDLLGSLEQVGDQLDKEILDEALAVCPEHLIGSLAISLLVMRVQGARRECLALRSLCAALLDVIVHWYASSDTVLHVSRASRISEVLRACRVRLTQCFLTVWQGWSELKETRKQARDLQREQKACSQSGEESLKDLPILSWKEDPDIRPPGTEKESIGGVVSAMNVPDVGNSSSNPNLAGWGLDTPSAKTSSTTANSDDPACQRPIVSNVIKGSPRVGKGRPKSASKIANASAVQTTSESTSEEAITPVLAFEDVSRDTHRILPAIVPRHDGHSRKGSSNFHGNFLEGARDDNQAGVQVRTDEAQLSKPVGAK